VHFSQIGTLSAIGIEIGTLGAVRYDAANQSAKLSRRPRQLLKYKTSKALGKKSIKNLHAAFWQSATQGNFDKCFVNSYKLFKGEA
jgi:hypothetical protein